MALDCKHRPPCPVATPTHVCYKRTDLERAVSEGRLTVDDATALLAKYGVPISTPSRVYKGEKPKPTTIQQNLL